MPPVPETTTLVCLFHHHDLAEAALNDLRQAGVPSASITTIGHEHAQETRTAALAGLGIPDRDLEHLHDGLRDGGTILAVSAVTDHVDTVERIFGEHKAKKIDEVGSTSEAYAAPVALAGAAVAGGTMIPIVEEALQVGKRTVDQGGVRVFRHVVEMPVEASVNLREEHVVVERNPVDRIATAADFATGDRVIELKETAEEAVVGKTARVVEEVVVGKQVGQHTEHITDTVRKTVVDVEEIPTTGTTIRKDQTF